MDPATLTGAVSAIPARLLAWGVVHLLVDREHYACVPDWEATPRDWTQGYSLVRYHALLRDKVRLAAYAAAIEGKVEGKIVLEIGPGALAPLAQMAVAAGARKVYAMEANPRAAAAVRRLIRSKGLEGKLELLEGFSAELSLPEKAEVLLHEVIGYLGSDEGMVSIVHDAKQRLLVDGAVHIPARCTVLVAPAHIHDLHKGSFLARTFQRWFFGPSAPSALNQVWNFPTENILTEPQTYEDRELAGSFALEEERTLCFEVLEKRLFTGLLFWVVLATDAENTVNTLRGTTWGAAYLQVREEPLEVLPGDRILLETYQDLTENPRYRFQTTLQRNGESLDLGTQRIRWT